MPTEAYVRTLLARPELALVPESCAAEIALHEGLVAAPLAPVQPAQLAAVQDDDARENYTVFLRFRDGLLAAGTLEAYYLRLMRSGAVDVPAVFIDAVVQAALGWPMRCVAAPQWCGGRMRWRRQRRRRLGSAIRCRDW